MLAIVNVIVQFIGIKLKLQPGIKIGIRIGQVLEWPIKNIWINNEIAFVEWHFKCNYKNRIGEFDGVSIIKFDEQIR